MKRDPSHATRTAINPRALLNRIGQGRHFLQIPGPSNVPDRVLRAIDFPTIDHRGPEFQQLGLRVLEAIRPIFGTTNPRHHLPCVGHRRLGGGPRQYPECRRPRADGRDWPFRHIVEKNLLKNLALNRSSLRAIGAMGWIVACSNHD